MFKVCQKLCKIILQVLQNFTNLQSCRSSFSAGWRPNFASKYATCSPCRELHAPPAFAPLRVEKFCKRSAKKSTASPKFQQILTETCNLAGARSRLYGGQILQVNMRWKARAEIYAMPAFAPWKCMDSFEKRPREARKIFFSFFQNFNNFRQISAKFCRIFAEFSQLGPGEMAAGPGPWPQGAVRPGRRGPGREPSAPPSVGAPVNPPNTTTPRPQGVATAECAHRGGGGRPTTRGCTHAAFSPAPGSNKCTSLIAASPNPP